MNNQDMSSIWKKHIRVWILDWETQLFRQKHFLKISKFPTNLLLFKNKMEKVDFFLKKLTKTTVKLE